MSVWDPLADRFGRVHTNLRISVTDRCNIRCFYCMPAEHVEFKPRREILSFEEIAHFVRVAARLGVNKLRLTGGEPLVRSELDRLVAHLVAIPGIREVALTTNGVLLADQALALKRAGLHRLNISLDALDRERFKEITRRDELDRVLEGIRAARAAGFDKTKLNAVAIRGMSESELVPLTRFAREHDLEIRFIEFMPLDADGQWVPEEVLPGEEIRARVEEAIGPVEALPVVDPSQPATDYRFADGRGTIGFINPVTQSFCHLCNRLRLTADGKIRNCLFSTREWDARAVIRGRASDEELAELIREAVQAKQAAHGINTDEFVRPERAMYQIGG
jgi:cyclic pyranopterin phosphate synthase